MFRAYRSLVPYLKRHRRQYISGLIFLIITDLCQLYLPQLIRRAVDMVAGGSCSLGNLLPIALQMVGVAMFIALGRFLWRSGINGASRQIEQELRDRVYAHLQTLSSTFYGKNKTGDLMAHMTNDITAVRMATGIGFAIAVDGFFMIVSVLLIMLNLNSRLALVSLAPLPILSVGMVILGRIQGRKFRKVQEGFSDLSDMVQESFSGVRVLKTFVQELPFVRRFIDINREYSQRNLSLIRSWGFFRPAISLLTGVASLLFLLLGGISIIEGSMTVGAFAAFFSYLQLIIGPLLGAGNTINMLQRAAASLSRINRILEEKPDIASPRSGELVRTVPKGKLEVHNLSYFYPGTEQAVLQNINLEVKAGITLGILGRTGAGKTTLVNLLPRILDPPPGTIFLDGRDVRAYDLNSLRAAIVMVPQENFLFSASIRDNIAFGYPQATTDQLRKAAGLSTINRDFSVFPSGWDTMVGERGVTLSGGQKQRVSISRALATDTSIVIFDDALSSVDTETEDAILKSLIPHLREKTFIIVSHRISTLKTADLIAVFDEGAVIQLGSHEELITTPGFYSEIFQLQQLEDSIRQSL